MYCNFTEVSVYHFCNFKGLVCSLRLGSEPFSLLMQEGCFKASLGYRMKNLSKKTKNECSDSHLRAEYLKHLVESLFFGVLPHPVTQYDVEFTGLQVQSGRDMGLTDGVFVCVVCFVFKDRDS